MPYLFPFAPCTAHTFVGEDGERDTCYRCKAEKPKEKDRDGHSPKSAVTVATEIHSEKESVMTQFTPGNRVTVADDNDKLSPATVVNSSGFKRGSNRVTVHLDGKGIAVQPVHVSRLAPLATEPDVPEFKESNYSEDELHAEIILRGASENTTVQKICFWALDLEIPVNTVWNAFVSLGFASEDGVNNA
ncbi:hypothetical protein [Glutamicibacter ardleyensis]|uniref:Uncharacterized protein n=1 Tax=Glutamicibacter ardleyensis TaxID=225894 RepID=A0ABQ2DTX4_9MICC|nr:hypothetical protein [Glutamicibacter ardleyensis]GGJ72899.1 hypothetical protein GCM10007173_34930 [Glutamicibacter ardleyensis]